MGQPLGDWQAQIYRAYTTFGIRRWIPDVDLPDKNPEFEEEHPREEKGHGKISGRFEKKPRASTDDDDTEPRADLDLDDDYTDPYSNDPPDFEYEDDYTLPEGKEPNWDDPDTVMAVEAAKVLKDALMERRLESSIRLGDGLVRLKLYDENGDEAGSIVNIYKGDTAWHEGFFLEPPHQGKGIATEIQEIMEEFYRKNGIKQIDLHADADVGGYAWTKLGYNFVDPGEAEEFLELAEDEYERYLRKGLPVNPEVKEQLQALRDRMDDEGIPPTPIELSQLGKMEGSTMWFGKRFMLAQEWSARKKL